MGKSKKRFRSRSRERSRSPVISKRYLQEQINAIAQSVALLVEAQGEANKASNSVAEPQKGKMCSFIG